MDNTRNANVPPPMASASPAQAVKLLANQISVFAGTEDDDIEAFPSKLLLGYEMKHHSDNKLIEFLTELVKIQTIQDEDLTWLKKRDNSRKLAIKTTDKIKEYNKIYFDRSHKAPKKYKAGEYVRVKDDVVKPGESKKLKSDFKGPYMIDKVLPHNRYVVKDIPGFNITPRPYDSIVSPDKLRPWIKPVVPM
ncbi:hypothetical protein ALC57_16752 [Trachymyrmex cornetzi]|uniref:Uncharacterized protein n=1 Tax=Trachymyrmex cornetzi TaxID=471704 RepID=A0A151IUK2_9HYME|nr:hypothetical protein ALC57_16752 [Trachymyrmex cornetzi]